MAGKQAKQAKRTISHTPALEWAASGIGLLLTLFVLGVIGWEAVKGGSDRPPAIEVKVERVVPMASGYVVKVLASNRSSATASAVEIEGELTSGGSPVATSSATIDYIPGESGRRAGLFFSQDPRTHQLAVRALGYTEP